mmetsp:Transcript_69693/g.130061  ORF Transcript_69693/g.130061 Transcript_69693/m.130061 type:complete len:269 (+) Transcript_69693:237-1043(+)
MLAGQRCTTASFQRVKRSPSLVIRRPTVWPVRRPDHPAPESSTARPATSPAQCQGAGGPNHLSQPSPGEVSPADGSKQHHSVPTGPASHDAPGSCETCSGHGSGKDPGATVVKPRSKVDAPGIDVALRCGALTTIRNSTSCAPCDGRRGGPNTAKLPPRLRLPAAEPQLANRRAFRPTASNITVGEAAMKRIVSSNKAGLDAFMACEQIRLAAATLHAAPRPPKSNTSLNIHKSDIMMACAASSSSESWTLEGAEEDATVLSGDRSES